jgi:uncharacterized membrane protein
MFDKRLQSIGLKLCKIYFWIILLYWVIAFLFGAVIEKGAINEYINLVITIVMFIGVFGFLYKKRVFKPLFWKIVLVSLIIWDIYYTFIFPIFLSSQVYTVIELIINYLTQIPFYICVYLYSFKFLNSKVESDSYPSESIRALENEMNEGNIESRKSYKLSQRAFTKTKWVEILRINLASLLIVLICVSIVIYNFSISNNILAICFAFTAVYISIESFIRIARLLKRMKKFWPTFEILINDEKIVKLQRNTPYSQIRSEQISSITETEDFGLIVLTNDNVKHIFIPQILEGYNEIKEILSQWCMIKKSTITTEGIKKKIAREIYISQYVFNEVVDKKNKAKNFRWGCLFYFMMSIVLFILVFNEAMNKFPLK